MAYKTSAQCETLELLMAYRQKPSVHLRNRVVKLNVGLVRKIAHKIANQSPLPYEDLEQIGYIGLITAAERFDPSHGYAFSSFAIPYIKGEMLHFLRDHGSTVKIPRRLQQLRAEGEKAYQSLSTTLGRQPNEIEIAEALEIDLEEWRSVKLSSINRTPMSLNAMLSSGNGQLTDMTMTLAETLTDVHSQIQQDQSEERLALQHALTQLEDKTRDMIESVYLHQRSRYEVAERIGVSPVTVTRRITKGIHQLTELLQMPPLTAMAQG